MFPHHRRVLNVCLFNTMGFDLVCILCCTSIHVSNACVFSGAQAKLESKAASLVESGDLEGAVMLLTAHSNSAAVAAVSAYHTLFDTLVAKYHDGAQLKVTFSCRFYFVRLVEVP